MFEVDMESWNNYIMYTIYIIFYLQHNSKQNQKYVTVLSIFAIKSISMISWLDLFDSRHQTIDLLMDAVILLHYHCNFNINYAFTQV